MQCTSHLETSIKKKRWCNQKKYLLRHSSGVCDYAVPMSHEHASSQWCKFQTAAWLLAWRRHKKVHTLRWIHIRVYLRMRCVFVYALFMLITSCRFLAFGDSIISMSYQHLLGLTTVSNIISETCDALWSVLSKDVLPYPFTKEK